MKKLSDPSKAQALVRQLVDADKFRAAKRVKVAGMIAGNPPYDPKKLKETGQGHRTNVNFREAEGIINQRNAAFFHLFLGGRSFIDARLKDPQRYMGRARFWENIVTDEITKLIGSWDDFEYEMMTIADSMNTHGDAFPLLKDIDDWKFCTYRTGDVLFPKNTKASAGHIGCCVILDVMSVPQLYKKLDKANWDDKTIKAAIKGAVAKDRPSDSEWEDLQKDIENDALAYETTDAEEIKIAHILVKEDSGKITHAIIERGVDKKEFLYKKEEAYAAMSELLVPFICNIGNGYFHGLKGIGHRIFPSVQINNRFLCKAVDGAQDSASLVIGFGSGTSREGKILRVGNNIVLPPGAELQRNDLSRNIQGVTQVYGLLTQVNQSSTGVKRPGISAIAQNEKAKHTARGESMQAMEEIELQATDIALYYRQADMLYREIGKRMMKVQSAKKFRERCIDRGIPEGLLDPDLWCFKAPRTIGAGSKVMQSLTTQEMLSIAPYLRSENGKHNLIDDFIEVRGGPEAVTRYNPPFEDATMPSKSHQIAQLENNDLIEGRGVIVSVEDWHVPHLESHISFFRELINSVTQNPNPESLEMAMKAGPQAFDHVGNHMAYLKGDMLHESQFGEFQGQVKDLVNAFKQIEQAYQAYAQQQAKQQAEQQKQMQELIQRGDQAELQKKLAEIQADLQIRELKENMNHQVRVAKAQHGMQIAEAKAMSEIQINQAKASADRG
jgi:hypothetical protein